MARNLQRLRQQSLRSIPYRQKRTCVFVRSIPTMGFLIVAIPMIVLLIADFSLWLTHEAGHWVAWRIMGIRCKGFAFKLKWYCLPLIGLAYEADRSALTASQQLFGALGGPTASILFGIFLLTFGIFLIGWVSILLGITNLLPIKPLDGYNIYKSLRRLFRERTRACRVDPTQQESSC